MAGRFVLGIDLSASQNVYTLADYETGTIIHQGQVSRGAFYKEPSAPDDAPRILDTDQRLSSIPITDRLHTYLGLEVERFLEEKGVSKDEVAGIGISMAGRTFNNGRDGGDVTFLGGNTPVKFAEDIGRGYTAINVTKTLRGMFQGTPIIGGNDCNTTGNAQSFVYAQMGINPKATFYVTISTGVGGGGPVDDVDEIGHMPVANLHPAIQQIKCGCGLSDIEALASGSGIVKLAEHIIRLKTEDSVLFASLSQYEKFGGMARDLGELVDRSTLTKLYRLRQSSKKEGALLTSKDVCDGMRRGDGLATYILKSTAQMTAVALVGAAQIHGLERVGVGGGVGGNNPDYVAMIQRYVNGIAPAGNKLLPKGLVVEVTPLGTVANDYGALSLVAPEEHLDKWAETMLKLAEERRKPQTLPPDINPQPPRILLAR